jgi:hypothetical protein
MVHKRSEPLAYFFTISLSFSFIFLRVDSLEVIEILLTNTVGTPLQKAPKIVVTGVKFRA